MHWSDSASMSAAHSIYHLQFQGLMLTGPHNNLFLTIKKLLWPQKHHLWCQQGGGCLPCPQPKGSFLAHSCRLGSGCLEEPPAHRLIAQPRGSQCLENLFQLFASSSVVYHQGLILWQAPHLSSWVFQGFAKGFKASRCCYLTFWQLDCKYRFWVDFVEAALARTFSSVQHHDLHVVGAFHVFEHHKARLIHLFIIGCCCHSISQDVCG